jgi:hypothetical protein
MSECVSQSVNQSVCVCMDVWVDKCVSRLDNGLVCAIGVCWWVVG